MDVVTVEPADLVLRELGRNATLTAIVTLDAGKKVADPAQRYTFEWKLRGVLKGTAAELKLTDLEEGDFGDYSCFATRKSNNEGLTEAKVKVEQCVIDLEPSYEAEIGKHFDITPEITNTAGTAVATGDYTYQWIARCPGFPEVDEPTLQLQGFALGAPNATYTLTIKQGDQIIGTAKTKLVVTAAPKTPKEVLHKLLTGIAAVVLLFVLGLFWLPWLNPFTDFADAQKLVTSDSPAFPGIVAGQLMMAGVLVALAGVSLGLLQFRSNQRVRENLILTTDGRRLKSSLGKDAGAKAPELMEAVNSMKGPAQVLFVSMILFLAATVLAYRGLPDSNVAPASTINSEGQDSTVEVNPATPDPATSDG